MPEATDEPQRFSFTRMIDLSVAIVPDAPHEPWKPKVDYLTHEGGGLDFIKNTFGATEEDLVWSGGEDRRATHRVVLLRRRRFGPPAQEA